MVESKDKINQAPDDPTSDEPEAAPRDPEAELEALTDKWKRALAEAENARKRADAARFDGREHGVALAVEALALLTMTSVCRLHPREPALMPMPPGSVHI